MNIDRVSKDISCATTDWIEKYPNGGRFTTLTETFSPLLNELVKSCEWAVTELKQVIQDILFLK
ncbi:MAG: hypothetical protein IPK25_19340 [Saprospiraceae bacterium]|nr:hypothetical protein [Saprospiraceae bacterium]